MVDFCVGGVTNVVSPLSDEFYIKKAGPLVKL